MHNYSFIRVAEYLGFDECMYECFLFVSLHFSLNKSLGKTCHCRRSPCARSHTGFDKKSVKMPCLLYYLPVITNYWRQSTALYCTGTASTGTRAWSSCSRAALTRTTSARSPLSQWFATFQSQPRWAVGWFCSLWCRSFSMCSLSL